LNISDTTHFKEIKKLLAEKAQNVVIVSHRNPDGDAIGGTTAMYNLMKNMGHNAVIVVPNAFPQFLKFLPGTGDILLFEKHKEKCIEAFKACTLLFTIDFNDITQIREFAEHILPVNCYKVLIDHHPNPTNFANLTISETSVSSASELVYIFIKQIGAEKYLDKTIAECIYTGIMTDTGCFSFNSSQRQTFEVVAGLLDFKIDKDSLYNNVYNNYSFDRMRLMGHCLHNKMTLLKGFNTAYITLTQEDIKKYNFKVGDSEGLVNLPLSIKGVKFSALFTERDDIVKISLRSKGKFAVNSIAKIYFKGGGHLNAAGGESEEKLDATLSKFLKILEENKEQLIND
jgi:bifunctional oligoribonuclease and PAP phosphatase NrnA